MTPLQNQSPKFEDHVNFFPGRGHFEDLSIDGEVINHNIILTNQPLDADNIRKLEFYFYNDANQLAKVQLVWANGKLVDTQFNAGLERLDSKQLKQLLSNTINHDHSINSSLIKQFKYLLINDSLTATDKISIQEACQKHYRKLENNPWNKVNILATTGLLASGLSVLCLLAIGPVILPLAPLFLALALIAGVLSFSIGMHASSASDALNDRFNNALFRKGAEITNSNQSTMKDSATFLFEALAQPEGTNNLCTASMVIEGDEESTVDDRPENQQTQDSYFPGISLFKPEPVQNTASSREQVDLNRVSVIYSAHGA